MADFEDKLTAGLERLDLDGRTLAELPGPRVVAVSGGADSMAVLMGLLRLRDRGPDPLVQVHAAHLEHGLRGPAGEADAAWVEQFCQKKGVPFTIGRVDVATAAKKSGESIETEARSQRYVFLAKVAREVGGAVVVLGHTADDQVETILHRIVRGTGLRGLAGMAAVRPLRQPGQETGQEGIWLIRPLLEIRRWEVEAFLRDQEIRWREDATNASPAYTRNRIRHELLGVLRSFNPQVKEAILRLGRTAQWTNELVVGEAQELLAALQVTAEPGQLRLDARRLRQYQRLQQAEIVRAALRQLGAPERGLGHAHIVRVLEVLRIDGPVAVELPAAVRVRRSGGGLIFTRSAG